METASKTAIKAEELRIGNWVLMYGKPHQFQEYDFTWEEEAFAPIPLTPEILEKAGFENERSYFSNITRDFEICYYDGEAWLEREKGDQYSIISGFPIKYIHQLQNLYFALTGEELQIQL